jgi:hypothetical protein
VKTEPADVRPPTMAGPLVPPPPPREALGKRRKQQRPTDLTWLVWVGSLLVGIGLGVAAYQFAPSVDFYFDYWLALLLG